MPLELGIFLGARRFGRGVHQRKSCLVFDRERYRYQQFMSDIAGHDIAAHGNAAGRLISLVRDWLNTAAGDDPLPDGAAITRRFGAFEGDLPTICAKLHVEPHELTFGNYANLVRTWLTEQSGRGR